MVIREVQWFGTVFRNQNFYLSDEPDNQSKDFMCSLKPGISPKLLGHIQADQGNINIKLTNDTCTDRDEWLAYLTSVPAGIIM